MEDISPSVMSDSIKAAIQYLKLIAGKDPENARFASVNWNYMPYAGGSLIHPHLQVLAGSEPCNLDGEMMDSASAYFKNHGSIYWHDLVEEEKDQGQRYIGATGEIEWLATFAPLAMADITAVIPNCSTIYGFTDDNLKDLTLGFKRIISYYDSVNLPAFNMALYFAGNDQRGFCCTARFVGRYTLFPLVGSDVSNMQMLHHDPWTLHLPEILAKEAGKYFL